MNSNLKILIQGDNMKKLLYTTLLLNILAINLRAHEKCAELQKRVETKTNPVITNSPVLKEDSKKNENIKQNIYFDYEKLVKAATLARENAYAPYSKFKVGAAVLTEDGKIFTGCNVENASYGLTVCAERNAIFKAVSEGYTKFVAIAVVLDDKDCGRPCGACRQVIYEFNSQIPVIMSNLEGKVEIESISELLPKSFDLEQK
ncbi:MAG: cytidine deaminase [bacterium]